MTKITYMKKSEYNKVTAEKLRQKYTSCPPEGCSKSEIRAMSDDDILDMDYFLHEDDFDFYKKSDFAQEPDEIIRLTDDLPKDIIDDDVPL